MGLSEAGVKYSIDRVASLSVVPDYGLTARAQ